MSNLNSRSKLTEFPPLEPEEKTDGLKFSFSKFIWWKKSGDAQNRLDADTCSISSDTPDAFYHTPHRSSADNLDSVFASPSSLPNNEASGSIVDQHTQHRAFSNVPSPELRRPSGFNKKLSLSTKSHLNRSDSSLSNPSPELLEGNVSPFEARTLPNVLRRISNLIAMGTHNQSDIKKYWMPDSVSKECYECAEKFTTFRRKHHCRICGQIFCSRCCSQEIPGKIIGYSGDLRVCTYCCKIVLSYLNSADLNTDLTNELKLVQEDLQSRFGGNSGTADGLNYSSPQQYGSLSSVDHIASYRSLPRRKASLVYQEERFVGSQENSFDGTEETVKSLGDWVSIKSLWDDMCHPATGIDWSTHRLNMMKNYNSCAVGSELVDWLLAQRKVTWRGQGVQIGQMLLDVNLIECVSQAEQVFLDAYALYRPVSLPLPFVLEDIPESSQSARGSVDLSAMGHQDPLWMKQINMSKDVVEIEENEMGSKSEAGDVTTPDDSTVHLTSTSSLYSLDMNTNENFVSISKPKEKERMDPYNNQNQSTKTTPKNPRKPIGSMSSITTETMTDEFLQNIILAQKDRLGADNDMVPPSGWHLPQQLKTDDELLAFQHLCNAFIRHENEFLIQLLQRMNLSASWADIILPIVHKVTEIVRPDVRHADDDMDIRQYVQFKKVCGGMKEDCRIVNGVVCTKNVAHRRMRTKLKAPKILLIGSSIDYQRFENRFLSLEPLVMQEHEYLKNTVSRIHSLSPNLVLVEKSVSRLAQEFLLDIGITLVLNVKASVMERVARSTQGVIESSADTPIGRPQLGLCHNFYVETFPLLDGSSKTMMFFDGCATHLGCTVLLRGGTNRELVKVKKIMALMMLVAYNWRLERSFHIDLFAMPPNEIQRERPKDFDFLLSQESEKAASPVVTSSEVENEKDVVITPSMETITEIREKITLKTEVCDDLSDPLQSSSPNETLDIKSQDLPLVVKHVSDPTESNVKRYSFKKCLADVLLSASPFMNYRLPYLETEEGKKCKLRSFFPTEIYWSNLQYGKYERLSFTETPDIISPIPPTINQQIPHAFVFTKLSEPLDSDHVQELVSDFRRKGHRFGFTATTLEKRISRKLDEDDKSQFEILDPNVQGRVVDALDPFKHQKLSVLFCSFSPISCNFPCFCVNPWVVNMDMYGRNDISLGMFLERYCFRKTYLCPSKACDQPMISSHLRRFVHEHGCVTVRLKELEKSIVGSEENILMWNWCSQCTTVSPIVPMSVDAWSLSFAKYLELRFQGHQYTRRSHGTHNDCPHSLHHENVQYFAQNIIVCSFKYSRIKIWEICLPLTSISVKKRPKTVVMLIDDVKHVAITGHGVYTNILEILVSLRESSTGLRVEEVVKALLEHLKAEQNVYRSRIEDIQMNLTSPSLKLAEDSQEVDTFLWGVTDSIGFLKTFIADIVLGWNTRLHDVDVLRKKEEKLARAAGKVYGDAVEGSSKIVNRVESEASLLEPISHANSTSSINKTLEESSKSDYVLIESNFEGNSTTSGSTVDMTISGVLEELSNSPLPTIQCVQLNPLGLDDRNLNQNGKSVGFTVASGPPSPNQSVMNFERTKQEQATDKVWRSSGEYVSVPSDDCMDSKSDRKQSNSTVKVKALMSHFMATSGTGLVIQSPWPPIEHHFQAALTTIPIIVYESEPSSVVAFALSSNEYQTKRMDLMKLSPQGQSTNGSKLPVMEDDSYCIGKKKSKLNGDSLEEFLSSYSGSQSCTVAEDKVIYVDGGDGDDKDLNSKGQSHIEVQFASSTAKFYCRVYFAEKFRQLRKMCIAEGEEFYIRSISRCVSWAASGGKSGSTFCKTIDDRFVIKQMSKFEIDSFLDIAPNYFNYMKACYQDKKSTVLAKIVGVYRIGFKNSQNNAASKQDILVMENLFYQRQISQKFDLKGSIRNRLATASGSGKAEDLVLLDENLVNMACESPLYIRSHTKTVLTMAIDNDSKFLASQMVMDYSLLVGLDEEKNELVVGIIDYIRTFTWDKKIEAFVKSSGILGGQGKTPTVISPEEYQTRFCEAMYRYFLLVPDRWMGLGLGVDS